AHHVELGDEVAHAGADGDAGAAEAADLVGEHVHLPGAGAIKTPHERDAVVAVDVRCVSGAVHAVAIDPGVAGAADDAVAAQVEVVALHPERAALGGQAAHQYAVRRAVGELVAGDAGVPEIADAAVECDAVALAGEQVVL